MRAVVVGGGIGGLTAALCLVDIGWDVTVLEQAPELTEVGAGIQISPNGTKILDRLGVIDRLGELVYEPETVEMRLGISGAQIFSIPMRRIARQRWGAAYYQVHRADLVGALYNLLQQRAPGSVRTASRVLGYREDPGGIRAVLDDGETEPFDLLIGADGIHSAIRTQMLGAETPVFTGNTAWRAVVPVEALGEDLPPQAGCVWVGKGQHAVTTYLRGGTLVNFVGIVHQPGWREEGWDIAGETAAAARDFAGWHPVIEAILAKAEIVHRWSLFTRPPLPRWSEGRAILLGDACHPMLPSMAQGAVQAIEDAWALASRLQHSADVVQVCEDHYADRIDRVTAVQKRSARNSDIFHLSDPLLRLGTYGALWLGDRLMPRLIWRMQDSIYGYEIR
ncbi:MAG: FAD-dependent monooxygenase [Pseudomonadota bacterium]